MNNQISKLIITLLSEVDTSIYLNDQFFFLAKKVSYKISF